MRPEKTEITADVVIVGGGTAGCLAAVTIKEKIPGTKVIIIEKADIRRSGCLAAGMNAINAYLNLGETPESFAEYVRYDARGLIREDLVLSAALRINEVVKKVESWGLPIWKDEDGAYTRRGRWNIRISGENLKPLLAEAVRRNGVQVLNRVAATAYHKGADGRIAGVMGFGVRDGRFYLIRAKAVVCATGGAAGLYRPHNSVDGHHKTWYSPFNTGAGYAMGIRAGAEMTSFEMRFIALRTKDVICPTGTLALGFGAAQVNSFGERYMSKNFARLGGEGAPTCLRLQGFLQEVREGRDPCYMDTRHFTPEMVREVKEAYLQMYPGIVLYWTANKTDLSTERIEISGTEPYVMGGHCQAGYWVGVDRRSTLEGLYACGDVAGGYPFKFVSGCWAEGVIAGEAIAKRLKEEDDGRCNEKKKWPEESEAEEERIFGPLLRHDRGLSGVAPWEMEERLQKIMDEYAGGISSNYELTENRLLKARDYLARLEKQTPFLVAKDLYQVMKAHEVLDRLEVARVLTEHLIYRQETRWPGFQSRMDYPKEDDLRWLKFVNSRKERNGEIVMLLRSER